MRCLITGADGFLAANLIKRLVADGHEVTGAALNRKGQTSLDALGVEVRLEYGDITDAAYVARLVNAYEPEWLFHLAAVSIVRIANADPGRALRTNIVGTINVMEASRGARVIVASSDKAYGYQRYQYQEDMPLRPTGAYELSKACADQIARLYGGIVTRCANLFGPGDLNWSRLVPGSCRRAANGEPPTVYADAWHHKREWLHVEDAVNAYISLAERGEPGQAYNVGSGQRYTAGHIALAIAGAAGIGQTAEAPALGCYQIAEQELCSDKMRSLGWQPTWRVLPALEVTYQWYARHLGKMRVAA